jgi:hypothetical protein
MISKSEVQELEATVVRLEDKVFDQSETLRVLKTKLEERECWTPRPDWEGAATKGFLDGISTSGADLGCQGNGLSTEAVNVVAPSAKLAETLMTKLSAYGNALEVWQTGLLLLLLCGPPDASQLFMHVFQPFETRMWAGLNTSSWIYRLMILDAECFIYWQLASFHVENIAMFLNRRFGTPFNLARRFPKEHFQWGLAPSITQGRVKESCRLFIFNEWNGGSHCRLVSSAEIPDDVLDEQRQWGARRGSQPIFSIQYLHQIALIVGDDSPHDVPTEKSQAPTILVTTRVSNNELSHWSMSTAWPPEEIEHWVFTNICPAVGHFGIDSKGIALRWLGAIGHPFYYYNSRTAMASMPHVVTKT